MSKLRRLILFILIWVLGVTGLVAFVMLLDRYNWFRVLILAILVFEVSFWFVNRKPNKPAIAASSDLLNDDRPRARLIHVCIAGIVTGLLGGVAFFGKPPTLVYVACITIPPLLFATIWLRKRIRSVLILLPFSLAHATTWFACCVQAGRANHLILPHESDSSELMIVIFGGFLGLAEFIALAFVTGAVEILAARNAPTEGPICPNCSYSLIGLESEYCPECGLSLAVLNPHRSQESNDEAGTNK